MAQDFIDTYLATCVRACLEGAAMPAWPADLCDAPEAGLAQRIKFHGIALLLAQQQPAFPGWPASVTSAVKDEARMQALWEASHRRAIARLLEGLAVAEKDRVDPLAGTTGLTSTWGGDATVVNYGEINTVGADGIVIGNGLRGMRERLQQCGGELQIETRRGQGFRLCASVPGVPVLMLGAILEGVR